MFEKQGDTKTQGKSLSAPETAANDPALLTRKDLAKKLRLSPRSIDNLQRRKALPVIRLSRRCIRFSWLAVMRALERFEIKEAANERSIK
jgi:hypothetical protein